MHPELAEYLQCIDPDDLGNLEAVEASWLEAQRIMSPQGLENYLVGIKAMCTLGKGQDLVMTYVQEMPVVAKEVGEDIVPDAIEAIMKLSSLTSGSVITLILWPVLTAAYVWLALFEERQAREEFGSEYDVYARRTKRFLPGIV